MTQPLPAAHGALPLPGSENCVHCGFCLPACPTYLTLEDENDSPRGRIVLMKAIAGGTLSPGDPDARLHLDRCLGCRACETACPSGVPYGHLLELTGSSLKPEYRAEVQSFVTHRIGSTEKAEQLLGFRATTPLREGLAKIVSWRKALAAAPAVSR